MIRLLLLALALLASPAAAHEVRPAYLELRETAPNSYAVIWKQPASGEVRLALKPRFPADCQAQGPRAREIASAATVERWRIACAQTLSGRAVLIDGLERTLTSVYVRAVWPDGKESTALANPANPTVTLGAGAAPALARYVGLGVEHILGGLDHLAFVAGLVLLVAGRRKLLLALTAFTVAHSLTLGAAALGVLGLPSTPVEACIALSIVLVGYEAVRLAHGQAGLAATKPWLVAFGFGLLHGFGFAGALADIGLPDNARIAALLLFNLGVEIGQIMVVAVLLALLWGLQRVRVPLPRMQTAGGYVLGGAGSFWLLQRLATLVA